MRPVKRALFQCLLLMVLVAVSTANVFAAGAEAEKGQAAAKHIVQAAGGAAALQAVKAIRAVGEITAFVRRDAGRYERIWARGQKLWVKTTYARSTELRLLDGARGWRGADEHSLGEAKGPRLTSMLYQYLVLDLPFGLAEGRYQLSFVGRDWHGETAVDVFRLTKPASPEVFVFVDAEGYMVKSTGIFTVGSGDAPVSTSLSAEFGDFRNVDGLVLSHTVTFFARDMKIARTTIDRYELNPDIDAVLFRPQK